jgi:hypothetical protein
MFHSLGRFGQQSEATQASTSNGSHKSWRRTSLLQKDVSSQMRLRREKKLCRTMAPDRSAEMLTAFDVLQRRGFIGERTGAEEVSRHCPCWSLLHACLLTVDGTYQRVQALHRTFKGVITEFRKNTANHSNKDYGSKFDGKQQRMRSELHDK